MRRASFCVGIASMSLFLQACSAEPLMGNHPHYGDGGVGDVIIPYLDDGGNPVTNHVDPPVLGPLSSTSYWRSIPLQGTGPHGGTVLIDTDAAGSVSAVVGSGGAFCTDVPLRQNSINHFTLRAQDVNGNLSDPIAAQIEQTGSPPPPNTMPGMSQNVAMGGAGSSNLYVSHATPAAMIDGTEEYFGGWRWYWQSGWAWVQLSQRSNIIGARIAGTDDCPLQGYSLLVSDSDSPGEPSASAWRVVADRDASDVTDEFMFDSQVAKHVALLFKDAGCGYTGTQSHQIAEIQVWSEPNQPPPPMQAPTCSNGGTP
jgi:hypothetical protein